MNKTVRSIIAGVFLYFITLAPHMAIAYLHRRFGVSAVVAARTAVAAHTAAWALAALVLAFALLAAKR